MAPFSNFKGISNFFNSSSSVEHNQDRGDSNRIPVEWDKRAINSSPPVAKTSSSIPPPTSPIQNSCLSCVIRDNDARLVYRGSWSLKGSSFSTTHSSNENGASVSFRFNGSGIMVIGTVPQSNGSTKPPTASFILDAQPPVVTTEPTANADVPDQPLFFADKLSTNEHELKITIVGDDAEEDNGRGDDSDRTASFMLQRFFVFPNSNVNNTPVSTVGAPQPSSTYLYPDTASTPSPTPSSASQTPVTTSSPYSTTVRVLAGTLGSLVVLVILLAMMFVFRRRRAFFKKAVKSPKSDSRSSCSSSSSLSGMQERTILTSTESIFRNQPSGIFSLYTRSEQGRGSVIDYYLSLPSPPPPVPNRKSLPPTPPPGLPPKI